MSSFTTKTRAARDELLDLVMESAREANSKGLAARVEALKVIDELYQSSLVIDANAPRTDEAEVDGVSPNAALDAARELAIRH